MPTLQHIEASTQGRIRYVGPKRQKITTGHVFPQRSNREGYKLTNVPIFEDAGRGVYKARQVHRLVALAFYGLPPQSDEMIVVGHLDDDPGNNAPENLRWMTQRENCNAPGFIAKRRAWMRENRLGANNPFYGRQHTQETRAKMSAALREAAARRRLQAVPTTTAAVAPIFSRVSVAATSGPANTFAREIRVDGMAGNDHHA